jgi:hypothetical protein
VISISVSVPESFLAAYYPAMLWMIHNIMIQAVDEGISVVAASETGDMKAIITRLISGYHSTILYGILRAIRMSRLWVEFSLMLHLPVK